MLCMMMMKLIRSTGNWIARAITVVLIMVLMLAAVAFTAFVICGSLIVAVGIMILAIPQLIVSKIDNDIDRTFS